MTERLAALLREEADTLQVPVPPVRETLAAGRRVRRRRTLTRVVAVAATVGVVGAIGFGTAALTGSDEPRPPSDGQVADQGPTAEPVDLGAVFASGNTVYLDGGATKVRMPEIAQGLYYSSAGLLVRTNANGQSDGGAPFHFELIRADHSVTKLDLTLGEVAPGIDPRQPYLAYALPDGNGVVVVVWDLATDQEVARVKAPDVGAGGGWEAPPVVLSGDKVFVRGEKTVALDWRTGEVIDTAFGEGLQSVSGNSALIWDGSQPLVVDATTGKTLLTPDMAGSPWIRLSPDGRFAQVVSQTSLEPSGFDLYDLESGDKVRVPGEYWTYGWTADDHTVQVAKDGVEECDYFAGSCTAQPLPEGVDPQQLIVLPGLSYES